MAAPGWRALAVSALLALPAWAALDVSHGTAQLPGLMAGVGEAFPEGAFGVGELGPVMQAAAGPAQVETAPAAATPFPPRVARWRPLVEAELAAMRATRGLDAAITPELVLAVIAAESGGDPDARSSAQAAGLMQVLPTTLAALLKERPTPSAFDPTANVRAGILYLDEAIRTHRGSLEWALAAYNGGIPSTLRARADGGAPLAESSTFAVRVMAVLAHAG